MWTDTAFTRSLGLRLPIVAAPMAGGPTTTELAAAVCQAGGLGVLAGGYLQPDLLDDAITELRLATSEPFGVNLMVPPVDMPLPDTHEIRAAVELFAPYAAELGLAWPPVVDLNPPDTFEAQLDVVRSHRVPVFSFTFGIPDPRALDSLRRAGTLLAGTATTPGEARALADAGVDVICAQGSEAGGHRGTFIGDPRSAMIGLAALLPAVLREVDLPVVASGGIMDGSGIAAVLTWGASAAQLGTAFLLCPEAGTSAPYRDAVATATTTDTVITSAYSGKPARGLRNRLTEELARVGLPPYPITNVLTREIRRRASELGEAQYLSLWAGQGVAQARELSAAALVETLQREVEEALATMGPGHR